MGFINAILGLLGLAQEGAPVVEQLLSGLGTFVAGVFSQLFGANAGAKVQEVVTHAENLVSSIDAEASVAENWVLAYYGDLAGLLKAVPGLGQHLYVAYNLSADHQIPIGTAQKLAQVGHANVRTKQPAQPAAA